MGPYHTRVYICWLRSLQFGVMWLIYTKSDAKLRHFKSKDDNITAYKWLQHDGGSFGQLSIIDGGLIFVIMFKWELVSH